jgi:hypothetical protein
MSNPARLGALALAVAALALACTSTRLNSVYVAPGYAGGAFERLMIVGLAESEGGRVQYENAFADKLAALGLIGIGSANVFPSREELTREKVGAWVREQGIRGVLVTRVQHVKREQRYVPPTTTWDLYSYHGYWASSPGYVIEETTLILETSLFDAADGKLVYTAVSESFQPSSREQVVREVVAALMKDLQERGLLPRPASS